MTSRRTTQTSGYVGLCFSVILVIEGAIIIENEEGVQLELIASASALVTSWLMAPTLQRPRSFEQSSHISQVGVGAGAKWRVTIIYAMRLTQLR